MWLDGRVFQRFQGLQGFKDFLLRGNVVDLAVAVVIGAAFTAVVNAFAADFLTPLIGLVGGGGKLGGQVEIAGQAFKWGAFISQVISFVLTAAVVYFLVVLPVHTIMERRRRGEEPGPVQPTQLELLVEIRDLLRAQQVAPASVPTAGTALGPAGVPPLSPTGQRPTGQVPGVPSPGQIAVPPTPVAPPPAAQRPAAPPPAAQRPAAPPPAAPPPAAPPPAAPPSAAQPPGRPLPPVPPRRRD
jgi:large conductance mechanosensitive channel